MSICKVPDIIESDKKKLQEQINSLIHDFEKKHDVLIFVDPAKDPLRCELAIGIEFSKVEIISNEDE